MSESSAWTLVAAAFVIAYLWTALGLAAVFRKAGLDARLAFVPFVNIVTLLRLGGMSSTLALLGLVPVLGWGVLIAAYARVSRAFGFGPAMAALAFVLLPVWTSVLGWGSARWLGASALVGASTLARASTGASTASMTGTVLERDAPATRVAAPPVTRSTYTPPAPHDDESPARHARSSRSILPSEIPWQPPAPGEDGPAAYAPRAMRSTYEPTDGTFDTAAEVSAVVGAPTRGEPRSALASVSAQHAGRDAPAPESPYAEVLDPDFRDPLRSDPLGSDPLGSDPLHSDPLHPEPVRGDSAPVDSQSSSVLETAIGSRRRAAWLLTPAAGRAVAITGDVVILGRGPVPDPRFPSAQLVTISDDTRTMSKIHARLERREQGWVIIDLDSTNGVVLLHDDGSENEATPGVAAPAGERFLLGDAEMLLTKGGPS